MKFNVKTDVDLDVLHIRARKEAVLIHENPRTAGDRGFKEILITCLYGQAAEVYMMTQGFTDDTRPYKDVISPDGIPTEVKVTEHIGNVPYVLKRCNAAASDPKRQYAKMLYIWINNKKSSEYWLHSVYKWNGSEFISVH